MTSVREEITVLVDRNGKATKEKAWFREFGTMADWGVTGMVVTGAIVEYKDGCLGIVPLDLVVFDVYKTQNQQREKVERESNKKCEMCSKFRTRFSESGARIGECGVHAMTPVDGVCNDHVTHKGG